MSWNLEQMTKRQDYIIFASQVSDLLNYSHELEQVCRDGTKNIMKIFKDVIHSQQLSHIPPPKGLEPLTKRVTCFTILKCTSASFSFFTLLHVQVEFIYFHYTTYQPHPGAWAPDPGITNFTLFGRDHLPHYKYAQNFRSGVKNSSSQTSWIC